MFFLSKAVSQQKRYTEPVVVQCWATVYDAGPALNQQWLSVWCLLWWGMWSHLSRTPPPPRWLITPPGLWRLSGLSHISCRSCWQCPPRPVCHRLWSSAAAADLNTLGLRSAHSPSAVLDSWREAGGGGEEGLTCENTQTIPKQDFL